MRDIAYMLLLFFICSGSSFSQVGIGTTNPSAELEIETSNTGIPALEMNPQTAPVGSANGQLAVIGDKLYMYNVSRSKWLSIESSTLPYARGGNNRTNQVLRFTGVVSNQNSGALMPLNGTIVMATGNISGGDSTKPFTIEVRNGTSIVSSTSVNLSGSAYSNANLNIDFSAGDYIIMRIGSSGSSVNNPNFVLWTKWRP